VQIAQDGDAVFPIDAAQGIHHQDGAAGIEGGDGLVGQHHFRRLHQGAGDGDPLPLAPGER